MWQVGYPPKRVTTPTWGPPPPCKQALLMEFRVNDGMASERINYSENLREEGGYRLPLCLDLCLHWLVEDPQAVWASARADEL